jgi:2'-5' RNA ligase
MEMSGLGAFYRGKAITPVILVNSLDACLLWHRLRMFLAGAGITTDSRYGFQPHITLSSDAPRLPTRISVVRCTSHLVRVATKTKNPDGTKTRSDVDFTLGESQEAQF